jgi:hypothetical protein
VEHKPPCSIDVGDLPCTKARITLQRQRKTPSADPRLIARMIRRSRSLSPRQTTRTFVQRHMRNSLRSCAGRHNVSVWSSSSFYPSQNRARLFRTGLPVPDRRRVTWRPTVGQTAGSGGPRRTKPPNGGAGDPRRTKQIRNQSSPDQRAVKANFAACQPHASTPFC